MAAESRDKDLFGRSPSGIADGSMTGKRPAAAFSASDRSTQENLSHAAASFLDFVERHPQLVRRSAFETMFASLREVIPNVPGMPKEQRYGIQPWPTLISSARNRELERVSVGLARLVQEIPRRIFDNDAKSVADFFQLESEGLAQLLISEPTGFEPAICRVDLFDTCDGLQCLEVNAGSVGGWQDTAFAPPYLRDPVVAGFFEAVAITPRFTNSIRVFLRNIVRSSIASPVPRNRQINLLFVATDTEVWSTDDHPREIYQREYAAVLEEVGDGWTGQVSIVPMSQVELRGGEVWAGGVRYDAVFEQQDRITDVSRALFRSFKAGLVNLYTGPISLVLGDKRSLALLSKLEGSRLFTSEERELIRTYIPWTRLVSRGPTIYEGRKISFSDLLANHREELVLKAGQSHAGKDILVGRSMDEEEWASGVAAALESGGWVVQKYLEPVPYIFQAGEDGCYPHEVVWGSFVYGGAYGGTYARMMPRGRGAVINVSLGAVVGLVFEVDD